MAPAASFPYAPNGSSGDWAVNLPGEASTGEVIVDANIPATPSGVYRWKCDETALPLVEASGFGHTLSSTVAGAVAFTRPTMRSDTTGHAVSQAGSAPDLDALWTPPVADTTSGAMTWAGLFAVDAPTTSAPFATLVLDGHFMVNLITISSTHFPARFYLYDGATMQLVSTHGGGGTGLTFFAFRITAAGVWKRWVGTDTDTGTDTYGPTSTWALRAAMNDEWAYKFQELHVWPYAATDTEVEAVRLALIGV